MYTFFFTKKANYITLTHFSVYDNSTSNLFVGLLSIQINIILYFMQLKMSSCLAITIITISIRH